MSLRIVMRVAVVALIARGLPARGQTTENLDFESRNNPAAPDGWFVGGQGYEVKLDEADAKSGKVALRMRRTGAQADFGVATGAIPVETVRGKTIRFGGAIKTEDVKTGGAGLWLRVDGPDGKTLAFDNMSVRIGKDGQTVEDDRTVRGTSPWKRYTIEVPVDTAAENINFGCLHSGDGTAWFDALTLEVDGKPYEAGKASLGPKPEQVAWLKANAVPFDTESAGRGFDDLRPLKAMIGDAHIASLGEATHGTAEFFRMKHRLTEFLASEMGFTAFAIEASMPEAFRLNDYVLRGEGDPKELLKGMYFWTWNTQEVLDMILWMREFNKSGRGRIEFLGFDMQEPKVAAEKVRAFVAKADSEYAKALDEAYDGLKSYARYGRDLAPAWTRPPGAEVREKDVERAKAEVGKLATGVNAVVDRLEKERDRLVKAAGGDAAAVDWAIQNARVVAQAVAMLTSSPFHRDKCMADNVDWILAHRPPGTKVVLWAHNGHVAKRPGAMGGFLRQRHGADMVVVGFAFHEGRYTAVARGAGLKANDAGPSAPGSVEWAFHEAGLPRAVLDLRKAEKGSAGSGWLAGGISHRNIGALAMDAAFAPTVLPTAYDLLIFFDRTTASTLLPPHGRE
jgi:erythromycin esterase